MPLILSSTFLKSGVGMDTIVNFFSFMKIHLYLYKLVDVIID